MRLNPRKKANLFSLLTFGYTIPLFKKGYKTELQENDLYGIIRRCDSKRCGDATDEQWKKSHSMYRLLWKRFGYWYSFLFLVMLTWTEIYSIFQPYTMSRLISYFEKNQTKISRPEAITCGSVFTLLNFGHYIYWKNIRILENYLALEITASLKSLLYYKLLRMSKTSLSHSGIGNIVTIITKDIGFIDFNFVVLMDIMVWTLQTLTAAYLLWAKLGHSAFAGIGILLFVLIFQFLLGRMLTKMKLEVCKNSDQRLQVTQEVSSAIRIVKMYTWEEHFINKIDEIRKNEIVSMVRLLFVKFLIVIIGTTASKLTFLILLIVYLSLGYSPDTETIFYVLNIFQTLAASMSLSLPENFNAAALITAAFQRLNSALRSEEIERVHYDDDGEAYIKVKHVAVKLGKQEIIKDVSLDINRPGLTVLTGVVGGGKSSFLKILLADLPVSKGIVEVNGTISYAPPEPWLFPATIRDNIIFGAKFHYVRYHQVLQICDLEYDLSLMEKGDETLVADRGHNLSKGQLARINLARAVYRNSDIYLLDDSLAALSGHVKEHIFNECILKFLKEKICILVTQKSEHIQKADMVVVFENGRSLEPKINRPKEKVLKLTKNYIVLDNNINSVACVGNDEKVDKGDDDEEEEEEEETDNIYQEIKKPGKIELEVYKKYVNLGGGLTIAVLILLLYIAAQFCESFSDKLLSIWIDNRRTIQPIDNLSIPVTNKEVLHVNINQTFNMYTVFVIFHSILSLVKYYVFLRFCRNASINIHKVLSVKIIKATMDFFDKFYVGNILNRYSYDLNNIDEQLPGSFPQVFTVVFNCVGSTILIATVSGYFLIPMILLLTSLIYLRYLYIPTGRNLKRLEASTRSPIVGHINSSMEGLTTIRAFKAEDILKSGFNRHQDVYNSAVFTQGVAALAFEFFMNTMCNLAAAVITVRFLFFEHDSSVGDIGLVLTQVFNLTNILQSGVFHWAQVETNMTSVERVLEYTEVPQEDLTGNQLKNWPVDGSIKFDKVKVTYGNAKEAILKSICFSVKPKSKIGVVGRTGAGKSSIISTLFRLYDFEGNIDIDGTNTKTLALSCLRGNIGIIPQDPILFTGTIRENIDPYNKFSDEKIWKAINKVKMQDAIPTLDTIVQEDGSDFSTGQKQLICMARVAIYTRKIVVLDEATANLDDESEKLLYSLVEEIFNDCTVLIVAHRIEYITKCDMIMVVDNGNIMEFDEPEKLLKNEHSAFSKICKEATENDGKL